MCASDYSDPGEADPRSSVLLPLETARKIDQVCERFEQALRNSNASIEAMMAESAGDGMEQVALLRELLALEIEYRLRRGEQPSQEEYSSRFHPNESVIELVFREATSGPAQTVPSFLIHHPRYRVVRLLASGGMGSVYYAEHRMLERPVALKIINSELLADDDAVDRFVREARTAACLSHPNVVTVFDAETAGEGHFLVMEYVAGSDLARSVVRKGPQPVELACEYVRQAALGLQHAHERGMVHRDITPRNLMLTERGQIKILDFGLAHFVSETRAVDRLAMPGVVLGSIDYMAPEQAADPHRADIRADIYGLGCTLYYLLAGQPPFPEGTVRQKIKAHAELKVPSIAGLRENLPPALPTILARMLAKLPEDRYQTPGEVAAALTPLAHAQGGADASNSKRLAKTFRKHLARLATAGALVCVPALAVRYAGWKSPSAPEIADSMREPTEAHRLYREGLLAIGQRQESQVRLAIDALGSAVELEPKFALAYAAMADAYNLRADYGWEMANVAFPKAQSAARKALAIEPDLAEAHVALAQVLASYHFDWKKAGAEYARALALKPQLPSAHHGYAWFLVEQGRLDEALLQMEQARWLAPDEVILVNNVGRMHYMRREYAFAVKSHLYALGLNPDFRKAHRDLGLVFAEMGPDKLDDALDQINQAEGFTEDGLDLVGLRAYAYARNGHTEEAERRLARLEEQADKKPLAYEIVTIYTALGKMDLAFNWLDRAFAERSADCVGIAIDPRLEPLRSDPRFAPFLKKAGLSGVKLPGGP